MAVEARNQSGSAPKILLLVAVAGWIVAGYVAWQYSAASDAAAQQIRQLEAKVTDAQSGLEKLRHVSADTVSKLQAALDKISHDRDDITKQLTATRAMATQTQTALESKLAESQAATENAGRERDEIAASAAKAQQRIKQLTAGLDQARADRDNAVGTLADTQAKLTAAQQELASRPAEPKQ